MLVANWLSDKFSVHFQSIFRAHKKLLNRPPAFWNQNQESVQKEVDEMRSHPSVHLMLPCLIRCIQTFYQPFTNNFALESIWSFIRCSFFSHTLHIKCSFGRKLYTQWFPAVKILRTSNSNYGLKIRNRPIDFSLACPRRNPSFLNSARNAQTNAIWHLDSQSQIGFPIFA